MAEKGIIQHRQAAKAVLAADSVMPKRVLCIAEDTDEIWLRKEDGTILVWRSGAGGLPVNNPRFTGSFGSDGWNGLDVRPLVVLSNGNAVPTDAATFAALLPAPHSAGTNLLLKSNGAGGFAASGLSDDGTNLVVARNVNLGSGQKLSQNGVDRITAAGAFVGTSATLAGWVLRNDPVVPTAFANIYGDGVATPSDSNWSLSIARNGASAFLNGSSNVGLNVANTPVITAYSDRVNLSTKLQIGGVDRISAAGVFAGTNGTFSGTLSWGGNILQDMVGATQNIALYTSGIASPGITNCSFRAAKDGTDSAINGSQYAGLLVNGVWIVTATPTGAEILGSLYVSKQRYRIQTRSEADFNLGDCTSSIVLQTSASGTITLSGGNNGDVWWVETSGGGIVVPSGVTLWTHNTSYPGPTTWNIGGGRPAMLIRVSATKWWAPNL